MDNSMKILKEIGYFTSTKEFYEEAKRFGERAVPTLIKSTQLQNLQTIANSTFKVTDILNYIKNQSAKHNEWNEGGFASKLLNYMYENEKGGLGLRRYTTSIVESDNLKEISLSHYDKQSIYLKVCREFIKQLLVHYLFKRADQKSMKKNEDAE